MHEALLPADVGVRDLPALLVDPRRVVDMGHGRGWRMAAQTDAERTAPGAPDRAGDDAQLARVYDTGGTLLGIVAADATRGLWQPRLAITTTDPSGHLRADH